MTGLYRGKFGGLELLTIDTLLTREEVRRNLFFYELDLHSQQDDENLIIDVIYDNISPIPCRTLNQSHPTTSPSPCSLTAR
ncbi:MAG: hypothetical protein NT074_03635 [Methanomicrobiales archaeon]|nr:hypothetical protein [Methanomicrobiales archaeon]